MKKQKGFIVPVLLGIIALLIVGGAVYIYKNNKPSTEPKKDYVYDTFATSTVKNDVKVNPAKDIPTGNPQDSSISSVNPSTVSVGQKVTITGSKLDPVNSSGSGIGWLTHPQVIVYIENSNGQSGFLFEEFGERIVSTASSIDFVIPSKVCKHSMEGGCEDSEYIQLVPGTYSLKVYVAGRNTTNSLSINIKSSDSVSVSGMSKYHDTTLGFSFWYPSGWTVKEETPTADLYGEGKLVKEFLVAPASSRDGILVQDFISNDKSILDKSDCGPAECPSATRYFFDANTHTWMRKYFYDPPRDDTPNKVVPAEAPADVSNNGMGGLHIFRGLARFGDTVFVPLSARNFVVVSSASGGGQRPEPLAKTIVADDLTVATSLSVNEQIDIIKAEWEEYTKKNL